MSVIGTNCAFCRRKVETPCTNSDDSSRCRRTMPANPLHKAPQTPEPLDVQIGGDHYKRMPIQPITYIEANELGFSEGNVVKYVTRWKFKGGIQDLEKARDVLTKKIAFEKEKASNASSK